MGNPLGQVVRVPMFDKFGFFRTERDAYDLGLFLAEDVASHRAADLG